MPDQIREGIPFWALAMISIALSGCLENECAPDDEQYCKCGDYTWGAQVCGSGGTWTECSCFGEGHDDGDDDWGDDWGDDGDDDWWDDDYEDDCWDDPNPDCCWDPDACEDGCDDEGDPFDEGACVDLGDGDSCVRYVNTWALGSSDGLSWDTAFGSLQEGIDSAKCAALFHGSCQVWARTGSYQIGQGCATDTVRLRPGVEVYGGFAGTETALEERLLNSYYSVIAGSGVLHAVTGADDSVLDGFAVTGGSAALDEDWGAYGGGMLNDQASPTVRNCLFSSNSAAAGGGAVANIESDPVFESCIFIHNSATYGAAILNLDHSAPLLEGCVLWSNGSSYGSIVENKLFSSTNIANSVLWANTGELLGGAGHVVSHSLVEGGWEGDGNIDGDPLFVDAWGVNFRLQPGSPCIDAADGDAAPELDFEGHPRVDDPDSPNTGIGPPWADMGAFEHQP